MKIKKNWERNVFSWVLTCINIALFFFFVFGCEETKEDTIWQCECTVVCDSEKSTEKSPDDYCGSESDAKDFINQATDQCVEYVETDDFFSECVEYGCSCDCQTSGEGCLK